MKFDYKTLRKDTGANLYEYLLLVLLVFLVAVPSVGYFGGKTNGRFDQTDEAWNHWVGPGGQGPG